MAQSVKFEATESRIIGRLQSYIHKARDARALLNGPILQVYKNAQLKRFETENTSETGQWKPLSTKPLKPWWISNKEDRSAEVEAWESGGYAAAKRFIYKDYPGSGEKLMIGTGKTYKGLTGDVSSGFKKVVTTRSLVISLDDATVPYAKYAALERPFMSFGTDTIEKIQEMIREYMMGDKHG